MNLLTARRINVGGASGWNHRRELIASKAGAGSEGAREPTVLSRRQAVGRTILVIARGWRPPNGVKREPGNPAPESEDRRETRSR